MSKLFKVLVIDDEARACERIRSRLAGSQTLGQLDPAIPVAVYAVQIKLLCAANPPESERWTFDPSILPALLQACDPPPDLILLDYGYVDSGVASLLREASKEKALTHQDIEGKVLTPVDLARWLRESPEVPTEARRLLLSRFLATTRSIYLYSFPSPESVPASGPISTRARNVRQVFPEARVSVIDTRAELYNDTMSGGDSFIAKHDQEFYVYQLAVILDYVVHKEILRDQLEQAKYLRIRRTVKASAILTAAGAAIGFGGQWVGGLVGDLVSAGHLIQAIAVGLAVIVLLFALGFLLPLIFERAMKSLLPPSREES